MSGAGLQRGLATMVAASAILLLGAGTAVADSTSVWTAASTLGLPVGASVTQSHTTLPSVSCGNATHCVAVGSYDATGGSEPMALTATGGVWSAAVAIAPPAGAGSAQLTAVSCPKASTCLAVGDDGAGRAIEATDLSGTWSAASELSTVASGSLSGISCASAGNCTAVGTSGGQPLALNVVGGTFGQAAGPALPSGVSSGMLTAVACTTPGNCVAAGSFQSASGPQPMLATETGGRWASATTLALPSDAAATQQVAGLTGLACPASGRCTAVGSYTNAAGQRTAMLALQSAGTWGQAFPLGLPAGTTSSELDSIACADAADCTVTGSLIDGTTAPLAATESGGMWSPATALSTPVAAPGAPLSLAVGCGAPERCSAAGTEETSAGVEAVGFTSHPSLVITSHGLHAGAVGVHYSARIAVSGGTGGNTWSLTGGALPTGLTLDAASGVISGTPTADGTASFSVAVSDDASPADNASATLAIRIGTPAKPPVAPPHPGAGASTHHPGSGHRSTHHHRHSGHHRTHLPRGARVGGVKVVHGSSVRFTLKCVRERHCLGRVAILVIEHLRGHRLTAINTNTRHARGTHTRTLWLGRVRYALHGGERVVRTLRLSRAGISLLRRHRSLHAGLALRPAAFRHATIEHRVTLHLARGGHRHGRHRHRRRGSHKT